MGADEKHAATYHGYTPTPDEVREQWAYGHSPRGKTIAGAAAEFDRMLEKVRSEAKQEALEEAADWVRDNGGDLVSRGIEEELTCRANQYKEKQ